MEVELRDYEHDAGVTQTWVQILVQLCGLGPVPSFFRSIHHLTKDIDNPYLTGLLWGLNKFIHVRPIRIIQ